MSLTRRLDAVAKALAPVDTGPIYLCTYPDRPNRPGMTEAQARAAHESAHGPIPAGARVMVFKTSLGPRDFSGSP